MKKYLLAICGLEPQVITETLFVLNQQGEKIDGIRILTTRRGKDVCLTELFRAGQGAYYQFLNDYGLCANEIDFSSKHVIAVVDEDGNEIDDLGSEEENELFLKACMEEAFDLTRDSSNAVYFSIAGGRQTMGASLSLAAQCYGRPQDRIFHVLVTREFENCRDFYYPPPHPRTIEVRTRNHEPCYMSTDQAEVNLISMPFFPLRRQLTPKMLKQPESPSALMLSLVRGQKNELEVNLASKKLVWKGVELDMTPAHLALYAFFAKSKKDSDCEKLTCRQCKSCYMTAVEVLNQQQEITSLYRNISKRELTESGIGSLDAENFNSYKSKINTHLEKRFGKYDSRTLVLESFGTRPSTKYGIALDTQHIRIVL